MRRVLMAVLVATMAATTAAALTPGGAAQAQPARERVLKVVEKRVIGTSVQGRPIVAYRKGPADATTAVRTVVLLGQMHGDETAGVGTARWALAHVAVRADVTVWIVPTMNPDGLARHTRTNARGVDLNRNWPMNWRRSARGETWSGPRASSEPETRAMLRFLRQVQPDFMSSIHQPYNEIGFYADKPRPFQRRLARNLRLPLHGIDIGGPTPPADPNPPGGLQPGGADNAPTLTGWYNAHFPGTAMTVEYREHPTTAFVRRAAVGLLRASLAY